MVGALQSRVERLAEVAQANAVLQAKLVERKQAEGFQALFESAGSW
jgi:hypothetical protein